MDRELNPSCAMDGVTLDKLLTVSDPQFSPLQNGFPAFSLPHVTVEGETEWQTGRKTRMAVAALCLAHREHPRVLVSFGWTKKLQIEYPSPVSLLSNNSCSGFQEELSWEPEDRERYVLMTTNSNESIVGSVPGVRRPRF